MPIPKKVSSFNEWTQNWSTNAAIERVMDNAAYTSAHPDDTFVFAGPPRLNQAETSASGGYGDFAAVGMLQNITVNQSKPFQPMMAIGSSRSFYMGGKAQGSAQIGRLFLNTQSLLRRLYDNVITLGGGDPTFLKSFDSANPPADADLNPNYLINLDSEFFLIPFGLGVIFKTKSKSAIGGFYMELCVMPNYTVTVTAGQSMIMEGVSLLFDRLYPLGVAQAANILNLENIISSTGE